MPYWCIFEDSDKNGTITVDLHHIHFDGDWDKYNKAVKWEVDKTAIALTGATPKEVHHIPYPAVPQLNQSGWPSFCYGHEQCWGRSACPKSHACND